MARFVFLAAVGSLALACVLVLRRTKPRGAATYPAGMGVVHTSGGAVQAWR